jgi:hypothetical protein
MKTSRTIQTLSALLLLLATLTFACSARREQPAAEQPAPREEEPLAEVEVEVAKEAVAAPEEAEVAAAPPAEEDQSVGREPAAAGPVPDFEPQTDQRLIIKDATLDLEVEDTDRAIDGVTRVAGDLQGYIISHRVWYDNQYKFATVTIAVPVQEFERALSRLRDLATRVLDETASGEDVTDQYVDLQSRLRNLEATRDRIRSFLDRADTIEELLEVNQQLSEMEDQIEQVRGRINFLRDRAAFSTITTNLNPILPTPTPTLTPTPAPTATPTATPTPDVWRPGETARQARDVLFTVSQALAELLIWFTIVCVPFILLFAALFWVGAGLGRRLKFLDVMSLRQLLRPRRPTAAPPAVEEPVEEDEA